MNEHTFDYVERNRLDAFCKTVLRNEAINYLSELARRRDREKSLDTLPQTEMDKLYTLDEYPSDSFIFSAFGYDLHIRDELVAGAFATLPEQEQQILIASLVGYLEAVESKMVTGAEQEEYIRVATEKAHHLKEFVTALFEWVKLDAGEQIFHFEVCDLNELSRNIMADWVPLLESHDLTYEIEIPETEYMTRVDPTAYTRIFNNLLQNILTHSDARQVSLTIAETEQQAKIMVADNGKGISAADLPHIFERMYQCDHSRSAKGNGLGLSIAKELVSVHKGTITATSVPGAGTTFTIILPKAL